MPGLDQIVTVAGFEINTMFRTRRALAVTLLYVLITLGVAALLAWLSIKIGALNLLNSTPGSGAKTASDMKHLLTTLAHGSNAGTIRHILGQPMVVIVFFTFELFFTPYLLVMVSFDMFNADVRSKFIRFQLLRASRGTMLAGKMLAHFALFMLVSAMANLVLFGYAWAKLPSFPVLRAASLLLGYWAITGVEALCYLALIALVSLLIDQGMLSMIVVTIVIYVFGLLALTSSFVHFLTPSWYRFGLFSPDAMVVTTHLLALIGFAAVFLAAGWWRLHTRDL